MGFWKILCQNASALRDKYAVYIPLALLIALIAFCFLYRISDEGMRRYNPKQYWTEQSVKIDKAIAAQEQKLRLMMANAPLDKQSYQINFKRSIIAAQQNPLVTPEALQLEIDTAKLVLENNIANIMQSIDRERRVYDELLRQRQHASEELQKASP